MKPRVAVLLGDPTGIGPELVAKLLHLPETVEQARIVMIGDPAIYARGAETAGVAPAAVDILPYSTETSEFRAGEISVAAGEYTIGSLRFAAEQFSHFTIDAL